MNSTESLKLSEEKFFLIRDKIVKLLEDEKCTVRQANSILAQVSRMISATAPVQLVEGANYEF